MVTSGFGFGLIRSFSNPDVVARPPVNPEFWREVNLTTVKRIPYSRAVGALVHQAMRSAWLRDVRLSSVKPASDRDGSSDKEG